eukprot:176159-Rhodomonas_salina.2
MEFKLSQISIPDTVDTIFSRTWPLRPSLGSATSPRHRLQLPLLPYALLDRALLWGQAGDGDVHGIRATRPRTDQLAVTDHQLDGNDRFDWG